MALVTDRLRFLHVPKTGGIWVEGAMRAAGVPLETVHRPPMRQTALRAVKRFSALGTLSPHLASLPFDDRHMGLAETARYGDRFTIAFVRHPMTWWQSYWAYRQRTGWVTGHPLDSRVKSDDFGECIEKLLAELPGDLSRRYETFVGPPDTTISFVGRFENLVDDLVEGLKRAGQDFDEAALRAHPPENTTDYGARRPEYTESQIERLAKAEAAAIDRFYGGSAVPPSREQRAPHGT